MVVKSDMKKIGVMSLPLVDNYGGMLQAVALYGYLSDRGYEVVSINNAGKHLSSWKRAVGGVLKYVPGQNFKNFRYKHVKLQQHKRFLESFLPVRTEALTSKDAFRSMAAREKFDAVIVGSDQVWRWDYSFYDCERYFLDFLNGCSTKRIAYAASFGKDHWQNPQKVDAIKGLLAAFDAVSTREASGVSVCRELGREDCVHVLDPTLLVGSEFYRRFDPHAFDDQADSGKTLVSYVLDRSSVRDQMVDEVSTALGAGFERHDLGLCSNVTVPQWVFVFKKAGFVVTDSFHGMVFAILFNKPFIAIANSLRGTSRFTSLLDMLGLSRRLVEEGAYRSGMACEIMREPIDFDKVNKKLAEKRMLSEMFIDGALGGTVDF